MASIKQSHVGDLKRAESEVKKTYKKLSRVFEYVSHLAEHADETRERICFTILEDDLELLMEECENTLVGGEVDPGNVLSLVCRTHTVLDEVKAVVSPRYSKHH